MSYLLYDIEASSSSELSNKIASYIRRGYEVTQIVVNPLDERRPYKAFLINRKLLKNIDDNLDLKENLDINVVKIDVSNCKIRKFFKPLLNSYLMGNSYKLMQYKGKGIFSSVVVFTDDGEYIQTIILNNPIDNKGKIVNINDTNELAKQLCDYWGEK